MQSVVGKLSLHWNRTRRLPLISTSSVLAIAFAAPAFAQAQTPVPGQVMTGMQPAVPSPATQVTAEQAGQPQEAATAPVPANG